MHRAPIEPARSARRDARPRTGMSRWRSLLARRRMRRKSSAFLRGRKWPSASGQATCSHIHSLIGPYLPPCDVSEEGHASTAPARTPNAQGPRRLPHHIAAGARSSSAPTSGSCARVSPDLTSWPAQVVRAPELEPIFRGARHSLLQNRPILTWGGQGHLAPLALL